MMTAKTGLPIVSSALHFRASEKQSDKVKQVQLQKSQAKNSQPTRRLRTRRFVKTASIPENLCSINPQK